MEAFYEQLIRQAETFHGGLPSGLTGFRLRRDGVYEEVGLTLTTEDVALTRLYAALAIYSRDVYLTGNAPSVLTTAVGAVEKVEKGHWGASAFPYQQPDFPFAAELARFPVGLTETAVLQQLDLTILDDPTLLHEWTLKAGVRLFQQLLGQMETAVRPAICSDNGPYGYVKDKKPVHDVFDAVVQLVLTNLVASSGNQPFAEAMLTPVAVCIGVLLAKKGLRTYCEPG